MKVMLPAVIALLGLGVGVGAGLALKPAAPAAAESDCVEEPCAEEAPAAPPVAASARRETVALDLPFVVPVFESDRVAAMVVLTVALDVGAGQRAATLALQPRLRDAFLSAMFRHANSGGFDGSFTAGERMADLKAALLVAAREVMGPVAVAEVLVTEIVRKDV
jgi:flagellar protein FliL